MLMGGGGFKVKIKKKKKFKRLDGISYFVVLKTCRRQLIKIYVVMLFTYVGNREYKKRLGTGFFFIERCFFGKCRIFVYHCKRGGGNPAYLCL